jgi:hypothetical protein
LDGAETTQALQQTGHVLGREFVFPDPNDPPTQPTKPPVYPPIPSLVAGDLGQPEGGAGFGLGGVPGAAVPEAAVHKYRSLALGLRVRQLFLSGDYYTSIGVIEGLVWGVNY